jgi:hypothetical protein
MLLFFYILCCCLISPVCSILLLSGVNVCAGPYLSSIPLYIRCVVLVSKGSPGSVGAIRIGPSSFPAENTVMDMGQEFSNAAIDMQGSGGS